MLNGELQTLNAKRRKLNHNQKPYRRVSDFSKSFTLGGFLPTAVAIECPSSRNRLDCSFTPPGNFSFKLPSSLTTRQYGVTVFFPFRRSSSAASAAIRMKIPVVSGQVTSTLLSRARRDLIAETVTSLPRCVFRISESTSIGFGISIVPGPSLLAIDSGTATIFE